MNPSKKKESYFNITFRDQRDGQIQTLKAQTVMDSTLGLSFVSISDFIFDTTSMVVNPAEEYQRKRFEHVKTFHLSIYSIYSILSIEEIGLEHKGLSFEKDKSNLVALPMHTPPPKNV